MTGERAAYGADSAEIGNCVVTDGKSPLLISKDAFWNCENVTVYDSIIIGEYLGWNSKNLCFVNCTIESNQGFCYIDGLKLENCTLLNTNLAFEYRPKINKITKKISDKNMFE